MWNSSSSISLRRIMICRPIVSKKIMSVCGFVDGFAFPVVAQKLPNVAKMQPEGRKNNPRKAKAAGRGRPKGSQRRPKMVIKLVGPCGSQHIFPRVPCEQNFENVSLLSNIFLSNPADIIFFS